MRCSLLSTIICVVMLLNDSPATAKADWNRADFSAGAREEKYFDAAPQWMLALDRAGIQQVEPSISVHHEACDEDEGGGCRFAAWQRQLTRWRGLPVRAQLARVDGAVNALPYVTDRENWGAADRWETPAEMFERGGDCEGFAIAKYHALVALGFDKDALNIAVVWDAEDREEHAVLFVRADGETWLLDNKLSAPQPVADFAARYRLLYAVSPDGARVAVSRPAAVAAAFSGARLSRNGRMLVWKVQPKKRAPLRSTIAQTNAIPNTLADVSPRQADTGRINPSVETLTAVVQGDPIWHANRVAYNPVARMADPAESVVVQLMIWAKDGDAVSDRSAIRPSRFDPATKGLLADLDALPLSLFAAG